MIILIIAGGSGTRLWPLSVPNYPKHLLKINGDKLSLLQNTYKRAKKISDNIYVVSEAGHINEVKKQLKELTNDHFIVEPARRGTASCIALSLKYLKSKHDPNEPIAILAADHYIRDIAGFKFTFNVAARESIDQQKIVLVGVEPSYPATGFGYIEKSLDQQSNAFIVKSFREKPDYKTATSYLKNGNYLWNCGYFVGSINVFEREMKQHAKGLYKNYSNLNDQTYLDFENISIDYALIEKVKDLLVVPATFDWMDLGTFADLAKSVTPNQEDNHITGLVEIDSVANSYIQNNEEKPMAVIGIDNCVIINTKDGILVTRKDLSQKVGDISKRFQ